LGAGPSRRSAARRRRRRAGAPRIDDALLSLDDAHRFLSVVFAQYTEGRILIEGFSKRGPARRHACRNPGEAARRAIAIARQGLDVYFGVGRSVGPGRKAIGVAALTIVWAEVDCESDTDAERDKLSGRIEELHPAPSIVVASASGYHAYWLLSRPVMPSEARRLVEALTRRLGADEEMHSTADALLRVPGTLGFASHSRCYDPPRPIRILRINPSLTYDPSDLARLVHAYRYASRPRGAGGASLAVKPQRTLLDAAFAHMELARRPDGPDGKVRGRCLFPARHKLGPGDAAPCDHHPSAVVLPSGYYRCDGCGLHEPASVWTQRPEVKAWAAALVRHVRAEPRAGGREIRMPRVGLFNAAALLAPHPDLDAVRKRGDQWIVQGMPTSTAHPPTLEQIAEFIRREGGPLVLRVWWACVALAQMPSCGAHGPGLFRCSTTAIADLLGFPRCADGKPHAQVRKRIGQALRLLERVHVTLRLSSAKAPHAGPLIHRTPYRVGQAAVSQIHPAVWLQIAKGPAWAPWDPAVLRLRDDETVASYLHARWILRDRNAAEASMPLPVLALRVGVWNERRFAEHRGAHLRTWRRWFDQLYEAGLLHVDVDALTPAPSARFTPTTRADEVAELDKRGTDGLSGFDLADDGTLADDGGAAAADGDPAFQDIDTMQ
jgi:hypothetical protein